MVSENREAQAKLEGIIRLACVQAGTKETDYPVKVGGDQKSRRAVIDLYIPIRNVPVNANTRSALDSGLIRHAFRIYKANRLSPLLLEMLEYDAKKDFRKEADVGSMRKVWSKPYNSQAAKEFANLMSASMKSLHVH